jgi:hypothetical protein
MKLDKCRVGELPPAPISAATVLAAVHETRGGSSERMDQACSVPARRG